METNQEVINSLIQATIDEGIGNQMKFRNSDTEPCIYWYYMFNNQDNEVKKIIDAAASRISSSAIVPCLKKVRF